MQPTFKPLFSTIKPEYIKYADSISELNNYQIISTDDFAKLNNFIWTESPLLEEESYKHITYPIYFNELENFTLKQIFKDLIVNAVTDKVTMRETMADYSLDRLMQIYAYCYAISANEKLIEIKAHLDTTQTNLAKHLTEPRQDLIVAKMSDNVGCGVFLNPKADVIEVDEIIAIYAGFYKSFDDRKEHEDYAFDLPQHPIFSLKNQLNSGFVDAKHVGNISRFIQDLPTQEELKDLYQLPAKKLSCIATANIKGVLTYYKNFPVIYLIATRKIQPSEQLGFSYGKGYWARAELLKNIKRFLFDNNGQLIKPDKYINYINFVKDNHYYCVSKTKLKQSIKNNNPLNFSSNVNGIAKNIIINVDELHSLYNHKQRFMLFRKILK